MVAQMNELNLFSNNPEFEEYDKMIKERNAKKRGPYQKHFKPIIYDPYTEMKDLYRKLANFLPLPLFQNETEVFYFAGVTAWHTTYTDEDYEYDNAMFEDEINGIFQGENFKVVEAEITGTENYSLLDRIELHRELIGYLSRGKSLDDALIMLKPSLNKVKEKYKIKELTQWLKQLRG